MRHTVDLEVEVDLPASGHVHQKTLGRPPILGGHDSGNVIHAMPVLRHARIDGQAACSGVIRLPAMSMT